MNTEPQPSYTDFPVAVFLDNVGRTVIAAVQQETDTSVIVIGPAVIDIVQGQAPGTFGIRIVPLILTELLADPQTRPSVAYNKASIAISTAVLQDELVSNYRKTLAPPSQIITPSNSLVTAQVAQKPLF